MQVQELMRRLVRHTPAKELNVIPVDTLGILLDCTNEALIEVWMRVPAELKKFPITRALGAPVSVEVSPTDGTQNVGTTLPDYVGCAIQLPGDTLPNRLLSENGLERPHSGTSGVGEGLVWIDGVYLGENSTILHDNISVEAAGVTYPLLPWPQAAPMWTQFDVSPGTPQYFQVRPSGSGGDFWDGAELIEPPTGMFLHVLPRPASACTLRALLNVFGDRVTIPDYQANRRLMIPDRFGPWLIRLAEEKLVATDLWNGSPELKGEVQRIAELSRADMKQAASAVSSPRAWLGTPALW